jgi:phage baseplate assembly protein V
MQQDEQQQLDLIELQRRLFSLIQLGVIHSADYPNARVRVTLSGLTSGWLPWLTSRAGGDRSWWAPEVGEQVVVLSPSGELAQAMVLPALYQDAKAAPKNTETVHHVAYADGTIIEYDRAAHKLTVNVKGGDVLVTTTGNLNASADGDASIAAGGAINITATDNTNIDGALVNLNQGTSGGVVCQAHVCAFTGTPHPQGSLTVKGGG